MAAVWSCRKLWWRRAEHKRHSGVAVPHTEVTIPELEPAAGAVGSEGVLLCHCIRILRDYPGLSKGGFRGLSKTRVVREEVAPWSTLISAGGWPGMGVLLDLSGEHSRGPSLGCVSQEVCLQQRSRAGWQGLCFSYTSQRSGPWWLHGTA